MNYIAGGKVDIYRPPDGNVTLVSGDDILRRRAFNILHLPPLLVSDHPDIGRRSGVPHAKVRAAQRERRPAIESDSAASPAKDTLAEP